MRIETSNAPAIVTKEVALTNVNLIFPEFGTRAQDVPHYDSEKHMYIVDQYTSAAGNRSLTYVAVGRQLVVEVAIGLYHCWTLLNKVRLLIPNGQRFKVVKTYEWEGTVHYDLVELRNKIILLATEYAQDNIGLAGGKVTDDVEGFVGELVADLLTQDVDSQLEDNGLEILRTYCRQMNLCKDFVTLDR